jgi:phosphate-selective porin OprO/OprP
VLAVNDKGVSAKSADGAYEFRLRGTVQADQRSFVDGDGGQNDSFLWRIVRPSLEGQLGKLVAFKLTPDFAGDTPTLVDAYVDLRFDPRATLRVGKFNGPVGLERLQSSSALAMMERAFPTELAPNRDIGVQLQGEFADGRVSYAAGVFNGAADGRDASASDPDDEVEFEGRVFFEPWKDSANALSGLGFGLAGSTGEKRGLGNNFLPRYRTPGQNVFFNYRATVLADGDHQRLSPQFYYYRNRLGLMGEWISSEQEVQLGSNEATHTSLENQAWQLTGSWVLTGEDASYRGVVKPNHPFALDGEGWGAFELVARYGELEVDEDAFPVYADPSASARRARAWGLGLNCYLTGNLKLVLNYTDAGFDGGAPLGADRADEKAVFSRLQVSF